MAASYILEHIRRAGIAADVCLASTTPSVYSRLEANECAQTLVKFLTDYPEDQSDLLEKCVGIYAIPPPKGYSHPQDTDLSVCLYLLYKTHGLTSELVAFLDKVIQEKPDWFFTTTGLARHLKGMIAE
jgi:hypothetical protein